LLDALTLRQHFTAFDGGTLEGRTITLVGDVLRSRVARSDILLFGLYGCKIRVVAPPTLAKKEFEALGAEVHYHMESALEGADVVMSLRMKHEYQKDFYVPNLDEYAKKYIVSEPIIARYAPNAVVLAPGPMIRGVEITSEVADGPRSLISNQVNNGVAVRMALLYLLGARRFNREAVAGEDLEAEVG
jgi:aspartate carbamoyltransferase catalytic subunit